MLATLDLGFNNLNGSALQFSAVVFHPGSEIPAIWNGGHQIINVVISI